MRLDSFLAKALQQSRAKISPLIARGLIEVNHKIVKRKDMHISDDDEIRYMGEVVTYQAFLYIMLHKPSGYISATKDAKDPTVLDLVPLNRDLFPMGRLDKDTEGLLILTNDGRLAHRLTSPNHDVPKTYLAILDLPMTIEEEQIFQNGIDIYDGNQHLFHTKKALLEKKR